MKYCIDSANIQQIDEVLKMGIDGVTANPSMYAKNEVNFYEFIERYANKGLNFLSAEVMGEDLTQMMEDVEKIQKIDSSIVIKINMSATGLKLCHLCKQKGIKTAMTLLFNMTQVNAAINAKADYIFPFIGRNDEMGADGLQFICDVQKMVNEKGYPTKVVAASIKNLHQLNQLCIAGIDMAAIPYELYQKSILHPLSESGAKTFAEDWEKVKR